MGARCGAVLVRPIGLYSPPHTKLIEILPVRLQPDFNVHAVGERGRPARHRADDGVHCRIRGDCPVHGDRHLRHPAAVERVGSEPCPQHDAVGPRITRCNAQCERIGAQQRRGSSIARAQAVGNQAGQAAGQHEKAAACQA